MFFRRCLAFLLDKALISSLVFGGAVALQAAGAWTPWHGITGVTLFALYRAAAHGRWSTTFGKFLFGLRVVRGDGRGLSFPHALLREAPIVLAVLPEIAIDGGLTTSLALRLLAAAGTVFLVAEIVTALRGRALHDQLADTDVRSVTARRTAGFRV